MTNEAVRGTTFSSPLPKIDISVANVARAWNYMVGGKDNFEADREAARQLISVAPVIRIAAPASRAFLRRAVRYLAAEGGIRQFLDIGTGLPTAGNTHEVAQSVAPQCRVVYVDNDPVVLAHARALLTSLPEGATSYVDADARDPGAIIAEARATLDFRQPVAVMMVDLLNFIEDDAAVRVDSWRSSSPRCRPAATSRSCTRPATWTRPCPKPRSGGISSPRSTSGSAPART